jgi:AhpD family alkylhydroperoxidase
MEARLNPFGTDLGPRFAKHLVSADHLLAASALPPTTQELVKIRASQINGCGGCLDMHTKEAAHAGETALRLNLVAAWRDVTVFTDAERAALELTEQGTRLADAGTVTDEVWANAARHYDEEQLLALVCAIALINTFNRLNVITRQVGGAYQSGAARVTGVGA